MIPKTYEEVANIIKNVSDPILIITDSDLDGICSGILMKVILKSLRKDFKIIARAHGALTVDALKELLKKNKEYKNVIILDSPYEPINEFININEHFIIYIDHHRSDVPKNIPENFVWFDIRSLGLEYISTTGAVYRIGKRLLGNIFEKYSLIGAIGAIGDFQFEEDSEIKKDFKKNYHHLYLNGSSFSNPFFILYSMFL